MVRLTIEEVESRKTKFVELWILLKCKDLMIFDVSTIEMDKNRGWKFNVFPLLCESED